MSDEEFLGRRQLIEASESVSSGTGASHHAGGAISTRSAAPSMRMADGLGALERTGRWYSTA